MTYAYDFFMPKLNPTVPNHTLTPKQKNVLDFIEAFSSGQGYAPSQQEIAKHFGFSSLGTVQNYLVRLERQGLLSKEWNAKRGMKVLNFTPPQLSQSVNLQLLGKVAAGFPIEAITTPDELDVPAAMIGKGKHFVLSVQGDSMIEDGILDGDFIIVKEQWHANNGQTVVALVNNEATVKRYYKYSNKIELRPANPTYKSIWVNPNQDFHIQGIVRGVIRMF